MARTLFDKIWQAHVVRERDDGTCLLAIDRHIVHDGTSQGFEKLEAEGHALRRPDLTLGLADHYVATGARISGRRREYDVMVDRLSRYAAKWGFTAYVSGHARQGIVHVAGPELGFTLPGSLLVCGDSHTSTHGALGALAFGIGASEIAHVLATQALWQKKPRTMRVDVEGELPAGVAPKDIVLALIARIGAGGANGHVIEYGGSVIRAMSMEGRFTICNMSIEAGARAGMIAPDDTTFAWLRDRPFAPKGKLWDDAVRHWRTLASDPQAAFDAVVTIDAAELAPTVTWGTSPQYALPVGACVPDPAQAESAERRRDIEKALAYMDLAPGTPLEGLPIDRVFIGSCTNGRLEDLQAAADVVRGQQAVVPALVVPGSGAVKAAAEAAGLHQVFLDAGFEWGEPGCSMCVGMNGDRVPEGERCASTSNRNFEGRQGRGARTHLVSPAMAAAAAIHGRITDVRKLA